MRQLSYGASGKVEIKICRGYFEPCLRPPDCCSPKHMACRRDPENGDFVKKCYEKAFMVVPLGVGVDPPEDPIASNENNNNNGDVEPLKESVDAKFKSLEMELNHRTASIESSIKKQNEKIYSNAETLKGNQDALHVVIFLLFVF